MITHNASDLYLTKGAKALLRIDDELHPISEKALTEDDIQEALGNTLTTRQMRDFESHMELNTSLEIGRYGRFRLNALKQRQSPALVIRRIVSDIPNFEALRLPSLLGQLSLMKRGIIFITGMTGAGKSTTLASMVDYRNQNSEGHIITIEDPIEFHHEHKKSLITQREVGVDTESYAVALKNSLRQRPDVILIGEVRDREVMEQTMMAAETGHLCLATIHATNSYQTIERIINLFPDDMHDQIRLSLSMNLKAILSQRLVPSLQGGMTLAVELMLNQGFIRELIYEGKIGKIREVIQQNSNSGMQTFDQALIKLYVEGSISEEVAIAQADIPAEMQMKLKQINIEKEKDEFELGSGLSSLDTSLLSISD
ncbi:MAG: type IV pili twitching motility protein PilT [Alphaproteobacteria bacterium]|nr:type IV pili twitching motility protein PilT [Alphaproteobacteria bacterium]